jgi:hypothetical protein
MSLQASIQNRVFFSGARASLPPRAALLTVELPVIGRAWTEIEPELRANVATLFAKEPLFGVHAHHWPHVFVRGKKTHEVTVMDWVVALCIAFRRWARDPAWQGQVVELTGDSAQLAIPWFRQDVFDSALQLALRHIMIHCEPPPERQEKSVALAHDLEQWLQLVQGNGLAINALRFALAAAQVGLCVRYMNDPAALASSAGLSGVLCAGGAWLVAGGTSRERAPFHRAASPQRFSISVPATVRAAGFQAE